MAGVSLTAWGVSHTTLEDVFLRLAKEEEAQVANKRERERHRRQRQNQRAAFEMREVSVWVPRQNGQKLGLDLLDKKGEVVVSRVHDGYAADASALVFAGDVVVSVNGTSTLGKKSKAVYEIIGPSGDVSLTLKGRRLAEDVSTASPEADDAEQLATKSTDRRGLFRLKTRKSASDGTSSTTDGASVTTAPQYGETAYDGPHEGARYQLRALVRRSVLLQSRQRVQCFCSTVFCPVVFLSLIILFQFLFIDCASRPPNAPSKDVHSHASRHVIRIAS